jgi:Mce-associated membrane protein
MTPSDEQPEPVAQPSAGGWPDPVDDRPADALGWPDAPDDAAVEPHETAADHDLGPDEAAAAVDEDGLDAWLQERDAATDGGDVVTEVEPLRPAEHPVDDEPGDPVAEPVESAAPVDGGPPSYGETPVDEPWPVPVAETDVAEGLGESVDDPVGDDDALGPEENVPAERSPVVAVVLAALVAVLLGLDVFLAVATVRTRGIGADEEARRDAIGAARNAARLIASYDYRHLDKDFEAALATTTGAFRDDYTRTTGAIKKDGSPARYKAVVVAYVSEAAVVTGDRHRVEVLVFLNQQSTSNLSRAPKITQSRVVLRLVDRDGDWLVEKFTLF